jgi:hypothetical protein
MKRLAFIKSLLRNLPTILEKKFGVNKKINLSLPRRIGRVVDCGSLENCCTARYRGFESLILRKKMKVWFFNQTFFYWVNLASLLGQIKLIKKVAPRPSFCCLISPKRDHFFNNPSFSAKRKPSATHLVFFFLR